MLMERIRRRHRGHDNRHHGCNENELTHVARRARRAGEPEHSEQHRDPSRNR